MPVQPMINIITIDREYGSGAADIAGKLAARLHWKLWDELLTIEIARMMGCDCPTVEEREERRDALHYRLFKAFMRGSFEGTLNAQQAKFVDADCIREAAEKVVREAAQEGNCVIVGRGSAYYLQSNPAAFHVFIYASFEQKVRRLQRSLPLGRDGRPGSRGIHQTILRRRVAHSPPLSCDDQFGPGR